MGLGLEIIIVVGMLIVLVALIGYIVSIYNGLIRLKHNIKKSWANIEVLLKQRSDELPKLINSVKGYMKHERSTLAQLTKARTDFLKAKTMKQKAEADSMITNALKTIFAVAENYPRLRANENFIQLQQRISGLENELADRREFYNDSVNTYNIRIHSFPDMIIARMMKCKDEELFKVAESDKKDVEVKF